MSEKFMGFSQDEINKVSVGVGAAAKQKKMLTYKADAAAGATTKQFNRGQHIGIRRMPEKRSKSTERECSKKQQVSKQAKGVTSAATKTNEKVIDDDSTEDINLDRSMSKSIEDALFYFPLKKSGNPENGVQTKESESAAAHDDISLLKLPVINAPPMEEHISSTKDNAARLTRQKYDSAGTVLSDALNTDSPFKGVSLKEFETHRRMIEEQNKQKKELLYKAIEHHSQKTAAETRKIAEIKNELAKLDNDLAVDVAILRKQIDSACIQFANIEKQYIKIEAQFLKAKIDLHNASEKKELLTEHLCTVIAHNEDRKAQKLSELMEKVGLTPTGDYEATQNAVINLDN